MPRKDGGCNDQHDNSRVQIRVQRRRDAQSVRAMTHARIVPGSRLAMERGTVVLRNRALACGRGANIDGTGLTVSVVNRA